jgi:hypothetical protein
VRGTLQQDRSWKPYPKNRKGRRVRLDPLTLALLADEWERLVGHRGVQQHRDVVGVRVGDRQVGPPVDAACYTTRL